ncbi:MAG: Do family serine endopeptidase [Candidatus Omnitrophota bacterium]|nr:MAG: Do family serine endopeptidase [Candidatus Omnitrophota bacterium]
MKRLLVLAFLLLIGLPSYVARSSDLGDATVKVASEVGKSVVSISSEVKEKMGSFRDFYFGSPFEEFEGDFFSRFFEEFFGSFPEREYKRLGLGSGVIIDEEGYILTNEHVVSGASQIKVKLSDGREFDAQIKGTDKRSDLAVIKVDARNLPAARLGDSDKLQIGEWVVAVGNPFGFAIENPEPTVTVGVVSALRRYVPALGRRERSYDDLIQTDAAINPGNSGGPLVNLEGEIVGINTAIITTTGGYQGVGFAIPVNKASRVLRKLIKGEKILYGWLGVSIQDLSEDLRNYFGIKEQEGVIIVKVYKDSPAQKGGLQEGDLILRFNNEPVKTTRDLVRTVSFAEVGTTAVVRVIREGKERNVKIKIGKRPEDVEEMELEKEEEPGEAIFRGIEVEDVTEVQKKIFRIPEGEGEGVVITYIEEDSPAQRSGLMVGDIITKVENKKIKDKKDFVSLTSKIKGDCLLKTNRGYFVLKEK